MRNRRFGVELEFASGGNGEEGVGDALTDAGFGRWVGDKFYDSYYGRYRYQTLGRDGSELELRSPILTGLKEFNELKGVVEVLNDLDCSVTTSDGLHVHHDAPEFIGNKELVIKLLKGWEQNQRHIANFVSRNRTNLYGPCPSIDKSHISNLESYGHELSYAIDRTVPRGNLNLRSLAEHGSIEFRYHEGTLNYEEIESWIRFGQSFLNGVLKRKNPLAEAPNPVVLLNRLKTSEKAKVRLINKATRLGNSYALGV